MLYICVPLRKFLNLYVYASYADLSISLSLFCIFTCEAMLLQQFRFACTNSRCLDYQQLLYLSASAANEAKRTAISVRLHCFADLDIKPSNRMSKAAVS